MILLIALRPTRSCGPCFRSRAVWCDYPHLIWGSFASFSGGFLTWVSTVAGLAIEAEGAPTYASKFTGFTTVP
jgi:hypothetical protein